MAQRSMVRSKSQDLGPRACLGASAAGGALAGALVGLAESIWIVSRASGPAGPGVAGYGMVLYGAAGLVLGLGLGFAMAVIRLVLRRRDGTRGGMYTTVAGLVLVFVGYPTAKFLIGRDVLMERIDWSSLQGLAIQAALLGMLTVLFFVLAVGLRRLLDRMPGSFSGPLFTPVVIAVLSVGLLLVDVFVDERIVARAGDAKPGGPHIVLVMVDTLRADVTDPYGGPGLTPNLGRLASSGVTFERAYAHSSWTRPSVATVFSGLYASSHGAMFKAEGLPDGVDTIAEVLGAAGYATPGIVSNFVTAPYFNFGQGFDSYVYLEPAHVLGGDEVTSKFNLAEVLRKLHARLVPRAVRPGFQYRDGSRVTAEALRWVRGWKAEAGPDDRFFLFVQYMDPHDPYFAHPHDGKAPSRLLMPRPDASMRDRLWELYRGEVRFWDVQFGHLVEGLESAGLWQDTLVVVFADHGEEFLEHGGFWHGETLYEEAIRVPLIVRLPGDEAAGRRVGDMVGLVDVAPTLVRLGGARVPAGYQGKDLFGAHHASIFAEERQVGNDLQALVFDHEGGGTWKVVACDEQNPRRLPSRSLFDLGSDPGEEHDLASSRPVMLEHALAALGEAMKRAAASAFRAKAVEIDTATERRLRELGYVQEGVE
jgi:arylsulfatase A-like enzyme